MKSIKLVILLVNMTSICSGQDTSKVKEKELVISFGTFNTMNERNKVNVNPSISAYLDDYYVENRYNYEAGNSASINLGKRILKKVKHLEIIPMFGLVFGSFKGITAELQTSLDYSKWTFSTDNQFSYEYIQPDKSLYFNWTVTRYKLTNWFSLGLSTVLDKHINQNIIFDKGVTAAISLKKWGLRFYAFNYELEKRYYWLSLRHTIKVKLLSSQK
jgi:hypothetical protein